MLHAATLRFPSDCTVRLKKSSSSPTTRNGRSLPVPFSYGRKGVQPPAQSALRCPIFSGVQRSFLCEKTVDCDELCTGG